MVVLFFLMSLSVVWSSGQNEESGEAGQGEPVELKVFVPNSPGLVDGMTAILDKYTESRPEVTYTLRSVPFKKYKDALQVMWSSNEVDDVITTGATLCACANVLWANGAKNVDLVTIAAGGKI